MTKFQEKLSRWLALPNTLRFNFRYLPFRDAIKLPFLVSHRVWLMDLSGEVRILSDQLKKSMIKIGFGEVGIFDPKRSRTIWNVSGRVDFKGKASLVHGCKIGVVGRLTLGNNLTLSAESALVVKDEISIGDNAMIGWEVLIMDTDFHRVLDASGNQLNPDAAVKIGDDVWIGCRSVILKGTELADGVVVAAGSIVSKPAHGPRDVLGGNPAVVLAKDVTWKP